MKIRSRKMFVIYCTVIFCTMLIVPDINISADPTPETILEQAEILLNELKYELEQYITHDEVIQYIDELTIIRNDIETICIIEEGEFQGDLIPEARAVHNEVSEEIAWLGWVNEIMCLTPETIEEMSEDIEDQGDTYIYPEYGTLDGNINTGFLLGWGSTEYTFVDPNPSGTGTAGSFVWTFLNAHGWSYTKLFNYIQWKGSTGFKDLYFKGDYKGDLFGSPPYPIGLSYARFDIQYFIADYTWQITTRKTFDSWWGYNGFWEYFSKSFNKCKSYLLINNHVYVLGVKLKVESLAWVTESWSNFAKDNYQNQKPAKWHLDYIRIS